jgi:hypothetical protein
MNPEMGRRLLLAAALAGTQLLAACGGVSRGDYVGRNEAIVRSLPHFAKAVQTHEVSTPYVKSEGGLSTRPSGYTTTVVYRVPRGTTAASVLRFYSTRLERRGWKQVRTRRVDAFTDDRAFVAVNTAFLTPAQRRLGEQLYEVVVDYRGAAHG